MANIKKLQFEDKDFYPITHIDAIVDDEGNPIKDSYVAATNYQKGSAFQVSAISSNIEIKDLNARSAAIADEIQNSTLGTLIDKVGDLNSLQVSDKTNAVTAVNSLINNITTTETAINSKIDSSTYNNKIAGFNSSLTNINNAQENIKQKIVNVLVNKEIEASKNESFTSLIGKIGQVEKNKKTVPAILNDAPICYSNIIPSVFTNSGITSLANHSVVLHNDKIYMFGGQVFTSDNSFNGGSYGDNNPYRFIFDTVTGETSYEHIDSDQTQLYHNESRSISYNNLIYTAGVFSYSGSGSYYGITAFDPQLKTWTNKKTSTNYTDYYTYSTMNLVGDNIYFFGGLTNTGDASNVARMFNLKTNTYTSRKTPTNYNPVDTNAVVVDNSLYMMGGSMSDSSSFYRNNMRYDISSNSWTSLTQIPKSGISGHELALYKNMIYIIGGATSVDYNNTPPASYPSCLYRYSISSNKWESLYDIGDISNATDIFRYTNGALFPNVGHKCIVQDNLVYAIGGLYGLYLTATGVACFILK